MKVIIVGGVAGGASCATRQRCGMALLAPAFLCLAGLARAQEAAMPNHPVPASNPTTQPTAASGDVAQANNPLANFTALNLHNYYIGELTDTGGEDANQFWMRFAKPFSIGQTEWIMRASLPVNSYPVGRELDLDTGIGDFNIFAAYQIDTGNPAVSFGLGPQLSVPSATEDALGSEKWSAGLVNVYFNASSKAYQYGYLMSWQHSFAGHDDRADVNVGAFQPFLFYQLGGGTYVRSSAVMTWNIENGDYTVPLGLGVGQVIPTKNVVFNLFVEPQVSVVDQGAGWGQWQIFVGLNMQFK